MLSKNIDVKIIYGSQTGTCCAVAERIQNLLNVLFHTKLTSKVFTTDDYIEAYNFKNEQSMIIFLMPTSGNGDPPDNMLLFWKKIMSRNFSILNSLKNINFFLLSFGDSSYSKYNYIGQKVYRRIIQLGANPLEILMTSDEPGLLLLDDNAPGGIMEKLSQFFPNFFKFIAFNLGEKVEHLEWKQLESPSVVSKFPKKYQIETSLRDSVQNTIENLVLDCLPNSLLYKSTLEVTCTENKRVTSEDHFQDTRVISFTAGNIPSYLPGDVVYIYPKNHLSDVNNFFLITGENPFTEIIVKNCPFITKSPLPAWWFILHYFDLNSCPSQFFFTNLASLHITYDKSGMTDDELERMNNEYERLIELGTANNAEDVDDLYQYVYRMKRKTVEILEDFPLSAKLVSISSWFNVLPGPIRPRPYSIASSPHENLSIIVAIVKYKTVMKLPRYGICTRYLSNVQVGDKICCLIKRSSASLNFKNHLKNTDTIPPAILIAPGTCISPMRSFLLYQKYLFNEPYIIHENVLIFGCRDPEKDFYYKNELGILEQENKLKLFTAFSRVKGKPKVYVQERIKTESSLIWNLLDKKKASIFIVANNKSMAADVIDSFKQIFLKFNPGTDETEASQYLQRLEMQKRFQIEAWS